MNQASKIDKEETYQVGSINRDGDINPAIYIHNPYQYESSTLQLEGK